VPAASKTIDTMSGFLYLGDVSFLLAGSHYAVCGNAVRGKERLVHGDRRLPPPLPAVVKPSKVTNSIRRLRFESGELTQAELAGRIGVTRKSVLAIE
jgi:hypothetical protein